MSFLSRTIFVVSNRVMPWLVPIELEAVSDYIQRLRMGNLIDSKSEAQAIIQQLAQVTD